MGMTFVHGSKPTLEHLAKTLKFSLFIIIIIIVQLRVDNKRGQTMPWKRETFWSRSICSKFWGFALCCTAAVRQQCNNGSSVLELTEQCRAELLDCSAFVPSFGAGQTFKGLCLAGPSHTIWTIQLSCFPEHQSKFYKVLRLNRKEKYFFWRVVGAVTLPTP